MPRVFDLDMKDVRIVGRDFEGSTYGPDQRQFKIVIEDPETIERLIADGADVWRPAKKDADDIPNGYLTVRVSYRYDAPYILLITPEGKAFRFDEKNVKELDTAWFKDVELHIHGSFWEKGAKSGVTVYLDTFVAKLISKEERDAIAAESNASRDAIRAKYKNYFNEE